MIYGVVQIVGHEQQVGHCPCPECHHHQTGTQSIIDKTRAIRETGELPDLDAIFKPVGHNGPHLPLRNPAAQEDA